jgi:serine/threonine-protein kinase
VPSQIGRYRLLDRVGRGAMGVVYSAHDSVMDRVVAIKLMAGDLESDPETRSRFHREAKIGGQLLHRNLTTVFDLGESDGRLYIVMELLRGQPLSEFLARPEGCTLEAKLDIMIQVCEGLAAAHAHGVFHRDVKPSNLFVQNDGSLKILDFGIARLATSTMTQSGLIIGTPDYMSPEQTMGREIDHRSDIFSVGAVFYYMLTGRKPFACDELAAVLRKVQREDPPPLQPSEAPPGLARILLRALAKRREERQQSARELVADLAGFRREWELDARRVAEQARLSYLRIEALIAERTRCAEQLGLAVVAQADPTISALREDYPLVAEQGADGLLRIPFRRDDIDAIHGRLGARIAELEGVVSSFHSAIESLRAAELAAEQGRAEAALDMLDAALRGVPKSTAVSAARDRLREQVARTDALAHRIRPMLDAAGALRVARNWAGMIELAEQVRELDPSGARADALRKEAETAIERERAARSQALTAALEDGKRALEMGRIDDAEGCVGRAEAWGQELASEAALAEAADLRAAVTKSRRASTRVAAAQSLFDSGRRSEAIEALRSFGALEGDAPGLAQALDRLLAEARRIEELEQQKAKAAAHLLAADRAWAEGLDEAVIEEALAAVALDPALDRAYDLVVDARVHARRMADLQASVSASRQALTEARALLDQGMAERAATKAEPAVLVEETASEASAFILEALKLESGRRIEALRSQLLKDRQRGARQNLDEALRALRQGQWDDATDAAASVLAADEGQAVARAAFRQALRKERPPGDTPDLEDTRPGGLHVTRRKADNPSAPPARAADQQKRSFVEELQARVRPWLRRLRGGQRAGVE